jgi:hypothetical protein
MILDIVANYIRDNTPYPTENIHTPPHSIQPQILLRNTEPVPHNKGLITYKEDGPTIVLMYLPEDVESILNNTWQHHSTANPEDPNFFTTIDNFIQDIVPN